MVKRKVGKAGPYGVETDVQKENTPETESSAITSKTLGNVSVKDDTVPDGPLLGASQKPNTPCFDYDPKTMQPVLNDEPILTEVEKKGVKIVLTGYGRQIYCCTLDDYEAKFGPLPVDRAVYEHFYPHAS